MKQLYIDKSIGIDFQKEMTTIVLLGKTLRGIELLDYRILHNASNRSEESDRQLIENLNEFRKRNALTRIRGAFCFPRNNIILKYIDIPTPEKEKIEGILEYEIERHVPLDKNEIYYDFQIIKQKEKNLYNVLIAVSRKYQVDHCINLLKEASIMPSMVSLSTASNFNLLSFIDYDHKIFNAIIEIGFSSINISFILDNSVNFTRSIPLPENKTWGGNFLEKTLSNLELEAAAEKFTKFLTREINLSLAGCREITSEQAIDCLYLSGGGLLALPIKKHLEQNITGIVRLLNPLAKLKSINHDISERDKSFLANAIGAGIQNHIKSDFNINLLPEKFSEYAQDHSFKAMLVLSGIFIFILLASFFSIYFKEQLTLNKIENELTQVKKEVITAENLEREYEKISRQKIFLQETRAKNPSRLKILKELTKILPSDVWLSNLTIKQNTTEIIGTADSTSKLVPLLEQSDLFTDVHFVDSITHINNKEKFKIKLSLNNVVAE